MFIDYSFKIDTTNSSDTAHPKKNITLYIHIAKSKMYKSWYFTLASTAMVLLASIKYIGTT